MPLRFDLGPFEKLRIGRSVISNSDGRAFFAVEGDMPILRDKDFLELVCAESHFSDYTAVFSECTLRKLMKGTKAYIMS